jgi:hypothetical protein
MDANKKMAITLKLMEPLLAKVHRFWTNSIIHHLWLRSLRHGKLNFRAEHKVCSSKSERSISEMRSDSSAFWNNLGEKVE